MGLARENSSGLALIRRAKPNIKAHMKEKIFQFLKTKLIGVQDLYLQGVAEQYSKTITEESQIETTLTDGVISVLKFSADQIQKEGDKRATAAVQTYEKNHNLKDGKTQGAEPNQNPSPTTETPEQKELRELKEWRLSSEKKEKSAAYKAKLLEKLTEKKIPHVFADGVTIENEQDIETMATSIEKKHTDYKQELINNKEVVAPPASGGGDVSKASIVKDIETFGKFTQSEKKN